MSTTILPFTVVDVFTTSRYEGNPLAIVSLPASSKFKPTQTQLQSIASEFNLSETIFLEEETEDDVSKSQRRARIFTTQREILFAGHPTIGATAYLLVHNPSAKLVRALVPGAGSIPISLIPSQPDYVAAKIPQTYHLHASKCPASRLLELHSTLAPFIAADRTFPIVSIVHGMTFILVELPDLKALAAGAIGNANANIPADGGMLDEGWGYDSSIVVYMFVRNAEAASSSSVKTAEKEGNEVEVIRTRMMVRGLEDPATGSAASALTGFLALTERVSRGTKRQWKVVQGVEMGRRSEIGVKVTLKDEREGGEIDEIEISGTAVVVSEGTIRV